MGEGALSGRTPKGRRRNALEDGQQIVRALPTITGILLEASHDKRRERRRRVRTLPADGFWRPCELSGDNLLRRAGKRRRPGK